MKSKSKKLSWHTELKKVDDLVDYSKNPRTASQEQEKGMDRSFKKFNYVELMAINADGTLIAGHERRRALLRAGRGEDLVEVRVPKPYLSDKVKNLNEIMNKETTSGNRLTDDILDLLNIWLVKRLPGSDYQHPTQKNPMLHEKALRRCTRPGDIVLDLTAGSGSIMSAAHQLNRSRVRRNRDEGIREINGRQTPTNTWLRK